MSDRETVERRRNQTPGFILRMDYPPVFADTIRQISDHREGGLHPLVGQIATRRTGAPRSLNANTAFASRARNARGLHSF
jgi:hypothetical protein